MDDLKEKKLFAFQSDFRSLFQSLAISEMDEYISSSIKFFANKRMDTNLIQLGISFASGLLCLLPLAFQKSIFDDSSLRPGLISAMYRDSAIMIIALVVPIALDKLADITNNSNKKSPDGQERGIFFILVRG
jgi:hypothetical protein